MPISTRIEVEVEVTTTMNGCMVRFSARPARNRLRRGEAFGALDPVNKNRGFRPDSFERWTTFSNWGRAGPRQATTSQVADTINDSEAISRTIDRFPVRFLKETGPPRKPLQAENDGASRSA